MDLMQVFQVYQGIIAIFSVANQQKYPEAKAIEPFDVKRLPVSRKIGNDQEFPAAGPVANGLHLGNIPQQVLTVFFGNHFWLGTHTAKNFDAGNHVVTVEPVV